eukprot:6123626-Prymnesium_polylepis.1
MPVLQYKPRAAGSSVLGPSLVFADNETVEAISFPAPTWARRRCIVQTIHEHGSECAGNGVCLPDGSCR